MSGWSRAAVLLVLGTIVSICFGELEVDDPSTVILTNIIFRHGDRTPVDPYPNDPYRNLTYWPEGFGQLTDVGKEQHYRLGKYLRKRYGGLLPEKYNLRDVLVRSTDVDRTLMSAESNLAGLFPPIKPWEPTLKWSPVPVHTIPEVQDNLVSMKYPCPKYDLEFIKMMESPELQKINAEYQHVYDYLTQHTGRAVQDPIALQYVYNTLWIEDLKKLPLPDWTKNVFPEKMSAMSAFSFKLQAFNKELQRLKGGPLIGEIVDHMKQKTKSILEPDRKLFMYSAHDTTVANILMTLGIFDAQTPAYTSTILLELHKLPQNYAVSILFRNETNKDPYKMTLPGCSFRCPLDKFVELTKPIIPENWMTECRLGTEQEGQPTHEAQLLQVLSTAVVIGSGIIVLLLISLLVLAITFMQHRNRNSYIYSPLDQMYA